MKRPIDERQVLRGNPNRTVSVRLGWLLVIAIGLSVPITAQRPLESEQTDSTGEADPADEVHHDEKNSSSADDAKLHQRPVLRLPPLLPDGRPLRPIALFLSQMDELIPDDYGPVSIDQLNDAIARLTDRATDDKASRLKSAVYWVDVGDGVLISNRSVIDIESDRPTEVRRSLGRVNLAIEPPQNRGIDAAINVLPRLESEPDGSLVAVFRGDDAVRSGIEFRWKLNGQLLGSGHEFTMQLPRTPQTRIVLSAPQSIEVVALDGVLRRRPGPPPDAGEFATDRDLRWYEIDAGGLSQVRIRTRQRRSESERGSIVVRRSSVQYEAESGGLNWNSRMVVQLPPDRQLPPLEIRGTTVMSVKINATDVPFSTKRVGNQIRQLQLEMPAGLLESDAIAVNVTVTGYSTWPAEPGWCDLAKPMWVGEDIIHASSVDEVQLIVYDPLQVIAWELPPDWKQSQQQGLEGGVTLFSADGPPIAVNMSKLESATVGLVEANLTGPRAASNGSTRTSWSRVRFGSYPDLESGTAALRMEVGPSLLTARARLAVTVDPTRVKPLRLLVEPTWSLDTVKFVRSGRVVEHTGLNDQSATLDLWPEAEDSENGRIVLEVTGSRGIPNASGGLVVPSSWFVRIAEVRVDLLAAIVPPADLNWSGEAAMERSRVKTPRLTPEQQEFFGVMNPETLWFQPDTCRTPPVLLQTPSISYNAASVLELRLEAGDIVEQLTIAVESQSQSLKQLVVHAGRAEGRPDMAWSISGNDDAPAINLPSSDVTVGRDEDDGVYTIDVSDTTLRGRHLVARRRYDANSELDLQLPSVPGAASQDSDVLISGELMVSNRSPAVQLVPLSARDARSVGGGISLPILADGAAHDPAFGRGWARLRYDAVDQPSITIATVDTNPDVTIVWREQVRVIASSRGTDRIEATYTVSPAAPLRIEYDPELQLASVQRDGVPVDLITLRQRPIVLQPRFKTEVIRVNWNRSQFGSSWVRRCRIPSVRITGTVLRSEYYLESASDSFAPTALLRGYAGDGNAIEMRPGDATLLLRRNTALAFGWLCAILVFAIGWHIAQRAPIGVAASIVVASAVLFLWWPWRLAVIGWLIVPLVAAGMLATSRAWMHAADQAGNGGVQDDRGNDGSASEDASSDFSVRSMARIGMLWATVLLWAAGDSLAQETSDSEASEVAPAVNVLVPVLEAGQPSGDMVYLPRTVLDELFQTGSRNIPQDARFQSANYGVRVNPSVVNGDQLIFAAVEAEYRVHIADGDHNTTLVRLPLAASALRRLETIDDVSRIIPFEADSMGQVIASLPRGNAFKIRATLRPMVTRSGKWTRLYLPIPAVASSRLTVESEQNVEAIRVGGASGRLLVEEEELLRRWVEEIGPTRSLEIDVRVDEGLSSGESRALGRRYWIHAGKRQVTIDCEVDPPKAVAVGETFQFVVRDSAVPNVVSSSWRFKGSELYSPTRRLITLESARDSPGPIRLLWTQPLRFNEDDQHSSAPIRIPEVIAAALGENSDAWIALHCDSALQFAPLTRESTEPLSVDQFLAAWTGYRGRIDRAFVPIGEIPSPLLQIKPSSRPQVDQSHHLHVMPRSLELFYTATVTPSDATRHLYRLQVPPSLRPTRVLINGAELLDQPFASEGSSEILLGDFVGIEQVEVEVVAIRELRSGETFAPPRLEIVPDAETVDQYRISRDRSTTLRVVKKPDAEPSSPVGPAMADSLAQGWIPVSTWNTRWNDRSQAGTVPGGAYQVRSQPTRFDCDQLIVLDRDHSHWTMETFVRFARRLPDYIDIEVPASWCESLEVRPATALSRQQAIDPSRQVIRIRCDKNSMVDNALSIKGQLTSGETGRVSVPSVRVLGFGKRRIHINVPNRLDNEPVQWRTSAVEGDELPDRWRPIVAPSRRLTYVAANPSWSIDLAPLPEVDAAAVAVSFDAQSFPQDDGALVMCHWDLFPGSLEAIEVRLPNGARCLGAWSAGQPVIPVPRGALLTGKDAEPDPDPSMAQSVGQESINQLTVPLALSRLSQPIELLIRVPSSATKQADYLPELIGIPVTQNWLTNYVPSESVPMSWREASRSSGDRELALARAAVEAIDRVDFIGQRPRDEVETWLRLWFARYRMIAESAGHQPFFEPRTDADQPDALLLPVRDSAGLAEQLSLPSYLQWDELDSRLAVYAEQFLIDSAEDPADDFTRNVFLFGVAGFDGFVPGRKSRISSDNPPHALQPAMPGEHGLRSLIVSGLTLVLIGGLLICLRPLQRSVVPIVTHPAFWLGLLGIFSFAVAPVPVAASLVLVAVALPVFPSRRKSTAPSIR